MIGLVNILFDRDIGIGIDILNVDTPNFSRSLFGVIYDSFGHRLFINVLFIQWRISL